MVKAAAVVGFNPENIISDALFYDGAAMSSAEIQTFLDSKIGTCRNGKCLNVLTTGISSRDAVYSQSTGNLICSAIQGGSMKVSELIYRVQVACGISAKVILVTLQKEQGLTTSKEPSDWNLKAAMGASCPDTAPCDPAFAGVGPQILKGTQQLKTYKAAKFAKQPGRNYVGYSPTESCGGTYLNIQNYATAALYSYTPYQPNAAALRAGYGIGDSCSSYGNRNFYQYFADWFGFAEQPVVAGAIKARYDAIGGRLSYLGLPTANEECGLARGGCYQPFAGGYIFISPAGGVFDVSQAIRAGWGPSFEWGPHGYPTGNTTCGLTKGGCYQVFENAVIYSSAMGSYAVESLMQRAYSAAEAEWGSLGYPVAAIQCGLSRGGCYQAFEGGQIFRNPAGYAFAVLSDIRGAWAPDFEWGALGYPVGVRECGLTDGGCYQAFEGGLIFSAPRSGAHALTTDFAAAYSAVNAEYGVLGYPTTDRVCGLAGGGCYQAFQGGYIYSSSAGVFAVRPEVRALWAQYDLEWGSLGYPTSSPAVSGSSYTQTFQGGTVTVADGVATLTAAADPWLNERLTQSWLGSPITQRVCGLAGGGCYQAFQGGYIYSSSAGVFAVRPEVRALWAQYDLEWGSVGYPTSSPAVSGSSYTQTFQGGTVTVADGVATLTAAADPWLNERLTQSWLGSPITQRVCGLAGGGCYQAFQGGYIYSSSAGVFAVRPEVRALWAQYDLEWGSLGYPTSSPAVSGSSYTQTFQGGTVIVTEGVARLD